MLNISRLAPVIRNVRFASTKAGKDQGTTILQYWGVGGLSILGVAYGLYLIDEEPIPRDSSKKE
ncbi:hypothetical protein H4219_002552 [Mycoemilia scoparia]|uniref:Uncharacterized protein n=1 Tax=Mycoemilia scoparia TaxID=417184 RepID=A0A9W8DUM4_9FUNG|nr:hypothetical protein H4219_002552 [Mycoemilia scoparia]